MSADRSEPTLYICPECGAVYSKETVPDPWPQDAAPKCSQCDSFQPLNVVHPEEVFAQLVGQVRVNLAASRRLA